MRKKKKWEIDALLYEGSTLCSRFNICWKDWSQRWSCRTLSHSLRFCLHGFDWLDFVPRFLLLVVQEVFKFHVNLFTVFCFSGNAFWKRCDWITLDFITVNLGTSGAGLSELSDAFSVSSSEEDISDPVYLDPLCFLSSIICQVSLNEILVNLSHLKT